MGRRSLDIKRLGLQSSFRGDLYHNIIYSSWTVFLTGAVASYLLVNAFFALLYYLGGDSIVNAAPDSYYEAFMFSFQTSSTIGYGHYLPKSVYANVVVLFDSISGILFVAITTGLAFSKFSRPTARISFSENVVIETRDGKPTLHFRVANSRVSNIIDASIRVSVLVHEVSKEGSHMRRIYDLPLVRNSSPMFALMWSVMHEIDEKSPFFELSEEEIRNRELSLIISLTGIDEVLAQTVFEKHIYFGSDIVCNRSFVDMISHGEGDRIFVDYSKLSELVS